MKPKPKYPTEWRINGRMALDKHDFWITQEIRGGAITFGLYEHGMETRDTSRGKGELRAAKRLGVTINEYEVRSEVAALMEIAATALKTIRMVAEAKWLVARKEEEKARLEAQKEEAKARKA